MSRAPDEADLQLASYSDLMPPLPDEVEAALADGDLRGLDLRRLCFRGHDLTGAHLEGCRLDGADLRDVSLDNANLSGASLVGAKLQGAHLTATDLSEADLSDALLDGATLERTVLRRSKLVRTRVRDCTWIEVEAHAGDWTGVDLRGTALQRVTLEDVDARGACLNKCTFRDSDLARLHLQNCQALGVVLRDSTVEDTEFDGADLSGAQVEFANWDRVSLKDAELAGGAWTSVAFRGCTLHGVAAADTRFAQCAGLNRATLDDLRDAGAVLVLPLHRRLWRWLGRIPFARPALLLALVGSVGAGLYVISQPEPLRPEQPDEEPDDSDLAVLPGVDAATAERWAALQDAYGGSEATRPDTLIAMSAVLEGVGRLDDAEEHLRESIGLLQLHPEQRGASPEIALGRFLLRQERRDEAFDVARDVIASPVAQADRVAAYLLIARVRVAQDDPRGALAELSTVTSYFGGDAPLPVALRVEAAEALEGLGEVSAALSLLEGARAEVPAELAELALARGDLMRRVGNTSDAVTTYDQVVRDFPQLPLVVERARQARADAMESADPEVEREQLNALAAAEDPRLAAEGELGLARLAVRTGDREAAVRRYDRVLDRFSEQPDAQLSAARELARLHVSSGEIDGAVAALQTALKASGSDETTVILREDLSKALQGAGRYDEARTVLRLTLKEFAADLEFTARANLHLAGIADQAGDVEDALTLYRQVADAPVELELRAAARFGEATLQRRIGKNDDALPLMDQVLEMLPAGHALAGSVAVERAELLVDLGRASASDLESMLETARAGGVDREQPVAYAELLLLLAETLEDAERPADALAAFDRVARSSAVDEDPGLRQNVLEGRVRALMSLGRDEEANTLLGASDEQALSGGGADEACRAKLSLARGTAEAGDVAAAADAFDTLLAECRGPRFLVGELPVLADLLAAGGLTERAQAMITAVRDGEVDDVGRQAAELELGRMGSSDDLVAAMAGPDRSLAALARIARGDQLVEEGRLAEAEPLWRHVAEDAAAEPVPRALALIGLGRLEGIRGNVDGARGHFEEAKLVSTEGWLIDQAQTAIDDLTAPTPD